MGKAGKRPPPDLYADCEFIWNAFTALSSSRIGFESIRFAEIEAFLNLNGIFNLEYRQEVTHLIRVMDLKYLEFMQDKYSKK